MIKSAIERMRHVTITALALITAVGPRVALGEASPAPQAITEFHVAPTGDDQNPGSAEKPFASLEKARDAARGSMSQATIILHDGVHRMSRPLELDARDSGKIGQPLVFAAAAGAHPVISGARVLGGWVLATAADGAAPGTFKTTLEPTTISPSRVIRQLYVNGQSCPRARSAYFRIAGYSRSSGEATIPAANWPAAFGGQFPKGLELSVCVHWRHLILHGRDARQINDTVHFTLADEERRRPKYPPGPVRGDTCHLENALALLDQPGEWYHEAAKSVIYYLPPPGQKSPKIEVPVLESLIQLKGSAENPVHDIEFRGITLEGSGWAAPSQRGLYFTQFAFPYPHGKPCPVPAALSGNYTERISFRDGAVRCVGANGISLMHAKQTTIAGNQFRDIGCNAIQGNGVIEDILIWNNGISKCGQTASNGGGILLLNPTRRARIEHNHIHDLPYSGLQVGGQASGKDVGTRDNKIRYNHVHHCMQLHDDGGGIYTLGGQQRGSEIAFNFVHDIKRSRLASNYPVDAIYLDNFTQFIHVHDNVIRDCNRGASQNNGSKNNKLENNKSADSSIEFQAGIRPGWQPS